MAVGIILFFCVFAGGYEEEIREDGEWLFVCEKGEVVAEISPAIFSLPEWEEKSLHGFTAGEDSLFISVFSSEGNGAVLAVFRKVESGYLFVEEFTSLFEGNSIEFSFCDPFIAANGELLFRLEWRAVFRGNTTNTGDEESCVNQSELSSFLILATDGQSLWTVHDHR
ncbi:MAG: hypothetical protein K8S62_02830 [Candidatus Sabulitectum sp.]|nr:hypothetical protein [Candidatus Sabulitectum sp.]